jgi:hypothetical protein
MTGSQVTVRVFQCQISVMYTVSEQERGGAMKIYDHPWIRCDTYEAVQLMFQGGGGFFSSRRFLSLLLTLHLLSQCFYDSSTYYRIFSPTIDVMFSLFKTKRVSISVSGVILPVTHSELILPARCDVNAARRQ